MNDQDLLYREAFMLAPIGICVSQQRVIKFANIELERMFGVPPGSFQNTPFVSLYPSAEEYVNTGDRVTKAFAASDNYSDERVMKRRTGELFWCQVAGHASRATTTIIWTFDDLSSKRPFFADLSIRDRQLAAKIAEGQTSKEIARELGLSHRTIEKYRAILMKKLGAATSAELVHKVMKTSPARPDALTTT